MTNKILNFDEKRFAGQLQAMLVMQDAMNAQVNPKWVAAGYGWHRALYVEAAEFLEHIGTWKWWKKATPDLAQARMKLVDIWHFGMSMYIQRFGHPVGSDTLTAGIMRRAREAVAAIEQERKDLRTVSDGELFATVDLLVAKAADGLFELKAFFQLLMFCGMDLDTLYAYYMGQNTLNRFRQDNGYKQGSYVKVWDGQEDNVHLMQLLETLPPDERLPVALYTGLQERYSPVAGRQH